MEYNELYHHGIQGMKWGVRRFQNKDGSLTFAGKKRVAERENNHDDYNRAHDRTRSVKSMSDAELRTRLNRLQMEQQYKNLSDKDIKTGKDYVNSIIKAGTTIATLSGTAITLYNNSKKIKGIIDEVSKKS